MLSVMSDLDRVAYLRVIRLQHSPAALFLLRNISRSGDGLLYALLALGMYLYKPADYFAFIQVGLIAFLLELPLFSGLKTMIRRDRPHVAVFGSSSVIIPHDKFSMPSGHSAAAFLMAGLLAHFYPAFELFAYGWASLIGFSRVALGVHYPSDIFAGAALGSCCTLLAIALVL